MPFGCNATAQVDAAQDRIQKPGQKTPHMLLARVRVDRPTPNDAQGADAVMVRVAQATTQLFGARDPRSAYQARGFGRESWPTRRLTLIPTQRNATQRNATHKNLRCSGCAFSICSCLCVSAECGVPVLSGKRNEQSYKACVPETA